MVAIAIFDGMDSLLFQEQRSLPAKASNKLGWTWIHPHSTPEGAKDLADKAIDKTKEFAESEVAQNIKKGTEDVINKTVEGAKDLADKAVDEAKKLGDSKIVQNIKKGAEDTLHKTVEGAKDLADKVTDKFKK